MKIEPKLSQLAEYAWQGELDLYHEFHPVERRFPDAEQLSDRALWFKGIASATAVDTGDGLVMLDTGARQDTEILYSEVRKWSRAPLSFAVFSHHHLDHIFGMGPFEREAEDRDWSPPVVYAHELLPDNFDRYKRTRGLQKAINSRQFSSVMPDFEMSRDFEWPVDYRYPDRTYRNQIVLKQGDLTFELNHARGETEDHTWTWVPELELLHPGDLFIWAVPNAGNPQKYQRFPGEWASALRSMAAKGAGTLLPGHGLPIFGHNRVEEALTATAELLEFIEHSTVSLMNHGLSLDAILERITVPDYLSSKPYLQTVYDHPDFIVRNVWRLYGGWYEGEPDRLLPAPRRLEAAEWIDLSGGVEQVAERVEQLVETRDYRLACHLAEALVLADPDSRAIHELRAQTYRARAETETSTMARYILLHAAYSSDLGVRDMAEGTLGD